MDFIRDENKTGKIERTPRGWDVIYRYSIAKYLDYFDSLFEKAKNISEFEFICTL